MVSSCTFCGNVLPGREEHLVMGCPLCNAQVAVCEECAKEVNDDIEVNAIFIMKLTNFATVHGGHGLQFKEEQ